MSNRFSFYILNENDYTKTWIICSNGKIYYPYLGKLSVFTVDNDDEKMWHFIRKYGKSITESDLNIDIVKKLKETA